MNCSELQNKILDYLYGEEAPSAEEAAHLESCSACQTEWNALAHTRSVFSKLPEVSPRQMTINRILAHARSQSAHGVKGILVRIFSFGLNPVPASIMALLAVAVIVVFGMKGPQVDERVAAGGIEKSGSSTEMVLANDQALRERLFENPFDVSSPSFNLKKRPVSSSFFDLRNVATDDPSLIDSDWPQAGLSIADLEKKWKERRKMLLESDADALMMRGRRLKAMGRVDLALRDFETIFRFYPDYTYIGDVLMYRAQCFAFQGDYNKALQSLEIFTEKFPAKKALIQPMIDQLEVQKTQQ